MRKPVNKHPKASRPDARRQKSEGAQLRPKRGRSASRGLPTAARRPGAPPRPRRRRPAALRRQRRSTKVNGSAEPRRLPLQVPRPLPAGRGDGLCAAPRWIEVLRGTGQPGEHVGCTAASPVLRRLLIFMMGERHVSTGCEELVGTLKVPLEDEDEPPSPTGLGGRPASCEQLPHPYDLGSVLTSTARLR